MPAAYEKRRTSSTSNTSNHTITDVRWLESYIQYNTYNIIHTCIGTHSLCYSRASLTPETERLLVAPLKVVMDHISEAFNQPRKARSGGGRSSTERMVWGKEGLGAWVASLAEQVRQTW